MLQTSDFKAQERAEGARRSFLGRSVLDDDISPLLKAHTPREHVPRVPLMPERWSSRINI